MPRLPTARTTQKKKRTFLISDCIQEEDYLRRKFRSFDDHSMHNLIHIRFWNFFWFFIFKYHAHTYILLLPYIRVPAFGTPLLLLGSAKTRQAGQSCPSLQKNKKNATATTAVAALPPTGSFLLIGCWGHLQQFTHQSSSSRSLVGGDSGHAALSQTRHTAIRKKSTGSIGRFVEERQEQLRHAAVGSLPGFHTGRFFYVLCSHPNVRLVRLIDWQSHHRIRKRDVGSFFVEDPDESNQLLSV